jgi:hypothetical protein
MNNIISSFIVLNNNGSINHEASISQFAGALRKYEAEREVESATIGGAVHAIFDTHKGKRLPMPYLTTEVLRALNVQPENFKTLSDKVQEYVRTSPEFSVAKGKGGGAGRVCDLTDKG